MEAKRLRLGVDTGGTFTDAVIIAEESGEFTIDKVPSTPSDHVTVSDVAPEGTSRKIPDGGLLG